MKRRVGLCILAALGVSACGGFEGDDGGAALGATASAATTTYRYDCTATERDTRPEHRKMSLSLSGTTGKLTNFWERRLWSLRYDANYRPRANNAGYARFRDSVHSAAHFLLEKDLRTGGYALRTGGHGGYLKILRIEDGYEIAYSWKYICRRK